MTIFDAMFMRGGRGAATGRLAAAVLAGALLGTPAVEAVPVTPPAAPAAAAAADVPAQKRAIETQISAAKAHHVALRGQVEQLEAHTADQQRQLQQRDAAIAALRARLRAAGVPAASGSSGR